MQRLVAVGMLGMALAGCAAELPMPTMPTLSTDTQREQARACQQTYALCQGPCANQGLSWGVQRNVELTKCTNNCKELLGDCYKTMQ
jgi:hypothetical protein